MDIRDVALGLLPATRCKERGRDFKHSQKLVQTYCQTLKKSKETATQLRKETIIQKGVNIQEGAKHTFTYSWDLLQHTYLPEMATEITTFFGSSSFLADGHLCCLSLRKGQTAKKEGEKVSRGKAMERRIKRDEVMQLEGMGRKEESLSIAGQKGW